MNQLPVNQKPIDTLCRQHAEELWLTRDSVKRELRVIQPCCSTLYTNTSGYFKRLKQLPTNDVDQEGLSWFLLAYSAFLITLSSVAIQQEA